MEFFINANVGYVMLVIGLMIAVLALFSPGTGLLEVGALFTLVLASYVIFNLPVNWWALVILALSFVPFIMAIRTRTQKNKIIYLAVSFLTLLLGSAFLFDPITRWPAVHPFLILFISAGVTAINWFFVTRTVEAIRRPKSFDQDRLIGMVGHVTSDIRGEGSVYVNGENWTAVANTFIPAGSEVQVSRREGLTLEVEPVKKDRQTASSSS
jgi:membrane-bound serine protease (ClpP class)